MAFFRKNKPADPAVFMAAIPVRNPLVKEQQVNPELLRLTGPLRHGRLSSFLGMAATHKSFELDALGVIVWRACDGHTSVEQIIITFAGQQRINIQESQVAVSAFLNTLLSRNLIALVMGDQRNTQMAKI